MAPHSSTLAWQIPWTEKPGHVGSGTIGAPVKFTSNIVIRHTGLPQFSGELKRNFHQITLRPLKHKQENCFQPKTLLEKIKFPFILKTKASSCEPTPPSDGCQISWDVRTLTIHMFSHIKLSHQRDIGSILQQCKERVASHLPDMKLWKISQQ
ncbi:hypothetical protein MG293_000833 [Ovis ammon polii]|uniref:Uncharacterized protein n=1 Tax=Ovis ammon polii TaxID=230172 RepID=A0AAD4YHN3_OVIAM|nr:hypothetical protein MG293_000833 [Ovis ammon polii]